MAVSGKLVAGAIVAATALAGGAMWYLQVHAFYRTVAATEIRLTLRETGAAEPIPAEDFEGIDAESSPLRFRGCFTTTLSSAARARYVAHEAPTPLNAPGWFGCFDAGRIGADLDRGLAVAYLGERGIRTGVDRVVAVYPDGRAYAWHQLAPEAGPAGDFAPQGATD